MELGLTRARVASLASQSRQGLERDWEEGRLEWERLNANTMLTQALRRMGEYAEALSLGVATLATARLAHGDEGGVTLDAMQVLGTLHGTMGNPTLALPLQGQIRSRRAVLQLHDH